MSVSLAVLLTAAVLIACGVYLVLERTLSRIVLGFVLLGNGVNLLFIVAAGPPGSAPFTGSAAPEEMTDPLPFAMVLTAIVISLGVTAFGVALAHRAWQLFGHDEVPDDVEDRRVLSRGRRRQSGERRRWGEPLTEEIRRGALLQSQGLRLEQEDIGADLSGAEDAPQDPTEADEATTASPLAASTAGAATASPRAAAGGAGPDGGQAEADADAPERTPTVPGAGPATDTEHDENRDELEEPR